MAGFGEHHPHPEQDHVSNLNCTNETTQPVQRSILRGLRIRVQKPENSGERCCVYGCSNRRGTDKVNGIQRSFHAFPNDPKRREMWIKAIPRKGWTPGKYDRVCGDHFVGGRAEPQEDSPAYVPSIFPTKAKATPRKTSTAQRAGEEVASQAPKKPRPSRKRNADSDALSYKWEESDHNYCKSNSSKTEITMESKKIQDLESLVEELEKENKDLKSRLLSIELIKGSAKDCQMYTGMPNYGIFTAVCNYLYRRCEGQLHYWRGSDTATFSYFTEASTVKPGPERKLDFEHEFLLTLVRLKTGKFNFDIARELKISTTLMSRVFSTWINFLAIELKLLFEMKVNLDDEHLIAPCFREYRSLKVVIDCTELVSERATNLQARKETYSNYKSRDTIKFMVGLSPNLTVNFVSFAYGGRASDKHITMESANMLQSLPPGSQVMADRGFRVEKELSDLGVELIIPDFKGRDRSQMSISEVQNSEHIAMARIHVERIIQRIRNYHVLNRTMQLCQKDVIEQMFTVCSYLVNFQTPIKATATSHSTMSEPQQVSVWEYIKGNKRV